MFRKTLLLSFLILFGTAAETAFSQQKMSERFVWPPVFEREFGDPTLVIKKNVMVKKIAVTQIHPTKKVILKVPAGVECCADQALKDFFLKRIWNSYFAPQALSDRAVSLMMEELIPLSQNEFFRIGRCKLAGQSAGELQDTWWKVRMGYPLKPSETHQLTVCSLAWAESTTLSQGHFCFAIRKRGGDPDGDFIMDFRAAWYEDRRPRASEGFNLDGDLNLRAYRENFYDWLYTQDEIRNCNISLRFAQIAPEQICLLKAFGDRDRDSGAYRLIRKNCSSLGSLFINQLLPIDQPLQYTHVIADYPDRVNDATIKRFGGEIAALEYPSIADSENFSNANPTQRAKPSREKSRVYQLLLKEPSIN